MNTGTAVVVSVAILGAAAVAAMVLLKKPAAAAPAVVPAKTQQAAQSAGTSLAGAIAGGAQLVKSVEGIFNTAKDLFGGIHF